MNNARPPGDVPSAARAGALAGGVTLIDDGADPQSAVRASDLPHATHDVDTTVASDSTDSADSTHATDAADRTDAADAWVIAALSIAQLISWGSIYYGFSLFIVPMEAELGWSRTAMNGALSVGLLVAGLCAYAVGRWIDDHGGRLIMTLGSLLASVLFLAWSVTTSLVLLFIVWAGFGLAMGVTLYDPVFAVVTRRYPHSFRVKIIVLTLVAGFASTVFIPLTQFLVAQLGWRTALQVLAACNLLICVPIHWFVLRDARRPAERAVTAQAMAANGAALARARLQPTFWALMLSFTCYYASFAAMTFHLVPLLVERRISTLTIVTVLALIGPAQVLARVVLLSLRTRLDTAGAGQIAMLLFSLSVLMLLLFPASVPMLFASILIYGAANGMLTIIRGTSVPDLLWSQGYGAINGLIAFPSNIAKALGPFGAALIWSAGGSYARVLQVVLAVSVVSAISFRFAVMRAPTRHENGRE